MTLLEPIAIAPLEECDTKHSPFSHLTEEQIQELGRELDAIRQSVIDTRGTKDAAYIRRVISVQRRLELGSRAVLLASVFPPAWILGTLGLTVSKILENMEIGHNILHGQWDWMRDSQIHSTTWEWDAVSTAAGWKHAHNEVHHNYTNIVGMDNDLGYGIMRVDEQQPWTPKALAQPFINLGTMLVFEYGIAMFDIDFATNVKLPKAERDDVFAANLRATVRKAGRQLRKDYVLHPLIAGAVTAPFLGWGALGAVGATAAANLVASTLRNVWSHSVIMCGHFPEGVESFELDALPENETKAHWYLRQMLGSANISGPKLLHVMTGNLSHQIEHHLFPDLPSNRYGQIAPQVRALFEKYGLSYNTRPMPQQVFSAWHKIVRLSFPNGWWEETTPRNLPGQLRSLWSKVRSAKTGAALA